MRSAERQRGAACACRGVARTVLPHGVHARPAEHAVGSDEVDDEQHRKQRGLHVQPTDVRGGRLADHADDRRADERPGMLSRPPTAAAMNPLNKTVSPRFGVTSWVDATRTPVTAAMAAAINAAIRETERGETRAPPPPGDPGSTPAVGGR